jgi:hypothetical protein
MSGRDFGVVDHQVAARVTAHEGVRNQEIMVDRRSTATILGESAHTDRRDGLAGPKKSVG